MLTNLLHVGAKAGQLSAASLAVRLPTNQVFLIFVELFLPKEVLLGIIVGAHSEPLGPRARSGRHISRGYLVHGKALRPAL